MIHSGRDWAPAFAGARCIQSEHQCPLSTICGRLPHLQTTLEADTICPSARIIKDKQLGWFSQMRDLWQTMGGLRFILFFGGLTVVIVGFGTTGWWLADKIEWPDAYGFHCRGKGCLWIELGHSYKLLDTATFYELLLFAWLWFIPASTVLTISFILTRRWMRRRRNRIRPLR